MQLICSSLLDNQDFLFKPTLHSYQILFLHILNDSTQRVLVCNAFHQPVLLPRRQRLGILTEVLYDSYFQFVLYLELAKHPPGIPNYQVGIRVFTLEPGLETRFAKGIWVYGGPLAIQKISDLVNEFFSIWKASGFAQILPERWMIVLLHTDRQSHLHTIKPRIYLLGNEAKALVNKTFNKLQRQGCLVYIQTRIFFSFPVFLVWKPRPNRKKDWVVVDIRKLNDLVVPDTYPIQPQSDIIATMQGCTQLAILNVVFFFY